MELPVQNLKRFPLPISIKQDKPIKYRVQCCWLPMYITSFTSETGLSLYTPFSTNEGMKLSTSQLKAWCGRETWGFIIAINS